MFDLEYRMNTQGMRKITRSNKTNLLITCVCYYFYHCHFLSTLGHKLYWLQFIRNCVGIVYQ